MPRTCLDLKSVCVWDARFDQLINSIYIFNGSLIEVCGFDDLNQNVFAIVIVVDGWSIMLKKYLAIFDVLMDKKL